MRRRAFLLIGLALAGASALHAGAPDGGRFVFPAIDGGALDLSAYKGGPVLVVNTASRCGLAGQFDTLQILHEEYHDRGLTIVGVPSDSFRQELGSEAEVRAFCEMNFGIEFPLAGIVDVTGPEAHPFYAWAAAQGVTPVWNFHKILLDSEGRLVAHFTSWTAPDAPEVIEAIEAVLPDA